jgi:hypothetical protein
MEFFEAKDKSIPSGMRNHDPRRDLRERVLDFEVTYRIFEPGKRFKHRITDLENNEQGKYQ